MVVNHLVLDVTDRERAREIAHWTVYEAAGCADTPEELHNCLCDLATEKIASALAAVRAETVEQCAKIPDAIAATWRNVALTGTPVYPHLPDPRPEMEIIALRYAELVAAIRALDTGDTNV